ncbi:MAG: signal peptidase I [Patescibacteria group bacterium]|jgi:signal peptidase I
MHAQLDSATRPRKPRNIVLVVFVSIVIFIYDVFKTVTTVLGVAFLIRFFLIQPFYVSGQSMDPTFEDNQYIIVDQVSYRFHQPDRGDVVVFRYPKNPAFSFIKRIIGLPGETVLIHNGEVTIFNKQYPDGTKLTEPYIPYQTSGEVRMQLKDGEFFVLGDNRPNSSDSRSWGVLNRSFVIGKVWVVLYPFDQFKTVHTPSYGKGL